MWLVPTGFVIGAVLLAFWLPAVDRNAIFPNPPFEYSAGSAQELLSAIAAGMIAFTGFVFSIVLLVVQFGSSAFTPRLLRSFSTDVTIKVALGVFVATFVYALLVLSDVAPGDSTFVPQYSVNFSVVMVVASIAMFLRLIANVTALLRVARVVDDVGRQARLQIETIFPEPATKPDRGRFEPFGPQVEWRDVVNPGRGGIVQALEPAGIVRAVEGTESVVRLLPAVGDFVPQGRPLFAVSADVTPAQRKRILDSIALGDERTLRQDPAFSLRILVDIAIKALSPAINDPTTAVQAIDHIGDILFALGGRHLPDGVYRDADGAIRFFHRTPTWPEYVDLAFAEIRTYGADSPQVVVSLRASLMWLQEAVPPWRRPALEEEQRLLELAVEATSS